jgi:hypothetical protein
MNEGGFVLTRPLLHAHCVPAHCVLRNKPIPGVKALQMVEKVHG